MSHQMQIDFTPKGHAENNSESQAFLNENLEHFSEQCRTLYLYLKRHPYVNLKIALNELDIWDLRRRCKDLRDKYGVTVYDERQPGGYKNYSLKPFA